MSQVRQSPKTIVLLALGAAALGLTGLPGVSCGQETRRVEGGVRRTEGGVRRTEGGERRVEGGERRTEGGVRRPEGGERRVEGGERRTEGGVRREVETQTRVEVKGDTMQALGILGHPAIHRELGLSDQQVSDLKKLSAQVVEVQRRAVEQSSNVRGDAAEARRREIAEGTQKRLKELQDRVPQILNEQQRKRFRELELQNSNMMALGNEDIAKSLKLNEEQIGTLKELYARAQRQQEELSKSDSKGEERTAALRSILKEFNEKAGAVLTAEQREQFERMKGEPFRGDRQASADAPRDGERRAEGGERRAEGGEKRVEGGERRTEGGERRVEGGERRPEGGERRTEGRERRFEGGERRPEGERRKE